MNPKWKGSITPGFDLSFSSTVVKSYLFVILFWMNKNESMEPKKWSETVYSQTQPAFICLNPVIIEVE